MKLANALGTVATVFVTMMVSSVTGQGNKGFECGSGETMVYSCFDSGKIEQEISASNPTSTSYIECGSICECKATCESGNCYGTIELNYVSDDPFTVDVGGTYGGNYGQISFKSGNEANPTNSNSNGNYAYTGRKAISHIDLCIKGPLSVQDPEPVCSCGEPSSPCMAVSCNSNGECVETPKAEGTSCGLSGGSTCHPTSDVCDANGTCIIGKAPDGTKCGNDESSCMYADSCSDGLCVINQQKMDGTACGADGDECNEPDVCQSGVCATDVFKATGTSCGITMITECHPHSDTCDGAGSCISMLKPAGSSCGNAEDSCSFADSCSIDGTCVSGGDKPDGTNCGNMGDSCNAPDQCKSGVCETEIFMSAGTSCGSSDNTKCDDPDTCDGSGNCVPNYLSAGTSCGKLETDCMNADTCDASGGCIIGGPKPVGTGCGDPTQTFCDGADTCDGAGTCLINLAQDGKPGCGKSEDECNFADKCMTGKCVSTSKDDGTMCGNGSTDECDLQDTCKAGECIDNVASSTTVCREACDGGCDVPEFCDGSSKSCPDNTFKLSGTSCGSPDHSPCDDADTCDGSGVCKTNFLQEGTVCGQVETPCMYADKCDANGGCIVGGPKPSGTSCGGPNEVMTFCDGADTCDGNGTCQSNLKPDGETGCGSMGDQCNEADKCMKGECVSTKKADGTMCGNGSTDACDMQDKCSNGVCVDLIADSSTVCRATANDCDVPEMCDGSSKSCPSNAFMASGTSCGSTKDGVCDKPDTCDGSGVCLKNYVAPDTVCGQIETPCMWADTCDATGGCVVGGPKQAGTSCGDATMTVCNGPDTCDGNGSCQDNLVADGTDCGRKEDQCNLADKCNVGKCISTTKPDGTTCGNAAEDDCDLQDTCSAGSCIDNIAPTTTVCRAEASDCDVAETCTGTSKACPVDTFKASGSSCGSSADTECDNPDTCDGSGKCMDNHEVDNAPCGYAGDQCMFADSCSIGSCKVGGPKSTATKCGTISGVCDVQDYCDGSGSCTDSVADTSVTCRMSQGECDPEEKCDGTNKSCPSDSFKPMGEHCGPTGSELEYCEVQDVCDGNGGCVDMGIESKEYTFKCGTSNYICGNDLTGSNCNENFKELFVGTQEQCDGMIAAANDSNTDTYAYECPNGNAISHYVEFDCHGVAGYKYELDGGNEVQIKCSRRLGSTPSATSYKFW